MQKFILQAATIICLALVWKTAAIAQAPAWSVNPASFSNSMSVTAQVYLDNVEENGNNNLLAAFVGNEVRGVASPMILGGKAYYFLTVYSNLVAGETVDFKVYLATPNSIHPAAETVPFVKNSQVGGYPDGFDLNISALNDFPISLLPIPSDTTLVGYPFDALDLDDYLVSQDNDPVVWTVVNGAHITGTIGAGNILTVTPNNPTWTGTENLLVTATEVGTANAYSASQYVLFKIEPDYGMPVFGPSPVHFVQEDVPLPSGNLAGLLDFDGTCVVYSFELMLPEGTEPVPGWQQPGTNTGSMSLVVRPDFGGTPVMGAPNQLAGFVDGQLAGVAGPQASGPGQGLYFLTLANVGAGDITFKFYDAANQFLHEEATTASFVPTGSLGDLSNPYQVDFAPVEINLLPNGTWTTTVLDPNWSGEQHIMFFAEDCEYGDKIDSLEVVLLINLCPSQTVELPSGYGLCLQADAGVSEVTWYLDGEETGDGSFFAAFQPGVYHYEGLNAINCPDMKSCPVIVTANASPTLSGNQAPASKVLAPLLPPCGQISLVYIIVDETPPTAICKPATVFLNSAGTAVLVPADVDDNSFTNCGPPLLSISQENFTCQHWGPNTVMLNIVDAAGRTDECPATVMVQDTIRPTVVCKNFSVALNAAGQAAVLPAAVFNSGNDNCGVVNLQNLAPNTFNCSHFGNNTVTLTVNDGHGNTGTCTATVTVTTVPTAVCNNITVNLDANGQAAITPAQVGGNSTAPCGIQSITASLLNFTCASIGTNSVTVTATDLYSNSAACTAIVTVADVMPPTALCKAATLPLNSDGNLTVPASLFNDGSHDNCGVASISVSPSSFSCANIGTNTVTLTVKDGSNNQSTCTTTLTITDFITTNSVFVTNSLCGLNNGSIVINATSIGGQLGYSINGGISFQFSNTFNNLPPGGYAVAVVAFGTANCLVNLGTLTIGEGMEATWYKDSDNDGYSTGDLLVGCSQPPGYKLLEHLIAAPVGNGIDCNDTNANIHPGAAELCNGLDDDCSGAPEAPTNTWTGAAGSALWSNAANWSDGIVPLPCQDVTVPTGGAVLVPAGFQAFARTLTVVLGADLSVALTGVVTVLP